MLKKTAAAFKKKSVFFAKKDLPATLNSARYLFAPRRGVRAGRRSTIGNRVYSKGTGSSNLPLSAINFKGLLKSNKPFFRALIVVMRDSMRDVLKNTRSFPVDAEVVQIDLSGADVHVSEHLLRPARVFEMGSHEVA